MTNGDIVLLLLMAAGFIIGFVWGTARSLLFLAGGFVVFLLAGYIRAPFSGFLSRQWTQYTATYNDMAAYGLLYLLGLVVLIMAVWFGARNTGLSARAPDIDRLIGGLVGIAGVMLMVAGLTAILAMFYGYEPALGIAGAPEWTTSLYREILDSKIGQAIHDSMLPALGSILDPLLPFGMREAFGGV